MFRDFVDLLRAFSGHRVEYLVVGAHALAAHGQVRATKDLDVWIRPSRDNAARAYKALAAFGAPLSELKATLELTDPALTLPSSNEVTIAVQADGDCPSGP